MYVGGVYGLCRIKGLSEAGDLFAVASDSDNDNDSDNDSDLDHTARSGRKGSKNNPGSVNVMDRGLDLAGSENITVSVSVAH